MYDYFPEEALNILLLESFEIKLSQTSEKRETVIENYVYVELDQECQSTFYILTFSISIFIWQKSK